ncbi:response regulator [Roseiconus lacunae]|uniref:Response regulator n=2 Tax=Roseiconus lacunae TaxID=2605694 RepID=A0ABT7PLB5_9BACT|nr:response regulator [Roseiconus lacunae]MDM4017304.1 response regulator [Roseiconus lacunae]WRQ48784.1 response regulator [Stieleria sp. HD01]
MLVLTRRTDDLVTFPEVGISLRFLKVRAGQARVGIDAPKDISIVRGELQSEEIISESALADRFPMHCVPPEARHSIRNELHQISVGMHLYRELLAAGQIEEAECTFQDIEAALSRLNESKWLQRQASKPVSKNISIALVEDDQNERELLAGLLRLKGYRVQGYQDGQSALDDMSTSTPPNIILVDMLMPVVSGAETVRTLRENERFNSSAIFVVSGMTPDSSEISVGTGGADHWFCKPLNPECLIDAIEERVHTFSQ